ncbi:MAG: hypothetical protein MZV64_34330 [Ignavibacteriales bacterium]|nr:hypothetical protein [Ignavibacteriales bacterium]
MAAKSPLDICSIPNPIFSSLIRFSTGPGHYGTRRPPRPRDRRGWWR